MKESGTYAEYTARSMENYLGRDEESRELLLRSLEEREFSRVLDLGCGAGQELLPFLEKTSAVCVGVDPAEGLGPTTRAAFGANERASFVRAFGEKLPFADESFDVVLCRVALPYMNNRAAIGEIARVLAPDGILLLKTHAPRFYLGMIAERLPTLSPRMLAYPLICLAGSLWHSLTGHQPTRGFWRGKEVFQTAAFLKKEFAKNGLEIAGRLPDDNPQTPSYAVIKHAATRLIAFLPAFAEYLPLP